MKVRVIGSGSMWNYHNSASYLIDDEIIVDFPNGMCKYLFRMNINPRNINDILITHFHGDHFFDIPFFLLMKTKADDNRVNIYCGKEGKRKHDKLLKLAFPNSTKRIKRETNIKYNFDSNFKIKDYDISRILVEHGKLKPAYGYIFTNKNIKVGFTGDSTICENVKYMASTCNYVFCDCMFIEGTTKHMGIDMLKELTDKYKDCIFVVSHLEEETREELNKLKIENVIVPEDGQIIDIK
jgi:ribonuclease BN (tRNA processing enzyme)